MLYTSLYLKKMGFLTPAWYMSLMTSWRRMPAEGIPIPWEMESTGPTLYIAYLHTQSHAFTFSEMDCFAGLRR